MARGAVGAVFMLVRVLEGLGHSLELHWMPARRIPGNIRVDKLAFQARWTLLGTRS